MMSEPVEKRRKAIKHLKFEWHPDRNKSDAATEVFQYINSSQAWFLSESRPDHGP